MEHTRFLRTCSTIQKLPDMYKEIRYLRNKIESLEKQVKKGTGQVSYGKIIYGYKENYGSTAP